MTNDDSSRQSASVLTSPTGSPRPQPDGAAQSRLSVELLAVLDEMRLWSESPSAAFERVAEQFYRETGFIAPGKSVPMEMASTQQDDRRRRAYDAWHFQRRELRHNTILESAEVISVLLDALKSAEDWLDVTLSPCAHGCECVIHCVQAAIARAEGRA
jgi:hypothetical protein